MSKTSTDVIQRHSPPKDGCIMGPAGACAVDRFTAFVPLAAVAVPRECLEGGHELVSNAFRVRTFLVVLSFFVTFFFCSPFSNQFGVLALRSGDRSFQCFLGIRGHLSAVREA